MEHLSLADYCATAHSELTEQWDEDKNGLLTPETVTAGARRKVWWHCEYGHSWQASVFSRTGGTGCPVCAGKVVEKGQNDLATTNPKLAAQWDSRKNGSLSAIRADMGAIIYSGQSRIAMIVASAFRAFLHFVISFQLL